MPKYYSPPPSQRNVFSLSADVEMRLLTTLQLQSPLLIHQLDARTESSSLHLPLGSQEGGLEVRADFHRHASPL